jgi:hypothetical protein
MDWNESPEQGMVDFFGDFCQSVLGSLFFKWANEPFCETHTLGPYVYNTSTK